VPPGTGQESTHSSLVGVLDQSGAAGIFRRTLNANLSISQLEMALRVAHSVDDC